MVFVSLSNKKHVPITVKGVVSKDQWINSNVIQTQIYINVNAMIVVLLVLQDHKKLMLV